MPLITFEGKSYECRSGERVLDCLMRHGVMLPSSCRSGVCQTCMVRAVNGVPPVVAQNGIKDTLRAQGYFLACVCEPESDIEISLVDSATVRNRATLVSRERMNESVLRLRMTCGSAFEYRAGQFINLIRPGDELVRSYSLASLPSENELELHVKRVPDGRMSNWIFDELEVGQELEFYGPSGDCFYLPGNRDASLLLIGTGTGLAPLYGIMRNALAQEHTGPIHFFHASLATPGLYMMDEMYALASASANMTYTPCVLKGETPRGGVQGNIVDIVQSNMKNLAGWRIYLCGDPPIVDALKRACFLSGATMQNIHSDPFVFAPQVG